MNMYAVAYNTEMDEFNPELELVIAEDEVGALRLAIGEADDVQYSTIEEAADYYNGCGWAFTVRRITDPCTDKSMVIH